jgi:hypothetical protein
MLSSKRRSVPVVVRGIDHVMVSSILLVVMDLLVVVVVSVVGALFSRSMTALRRGRRVIDVLASSSAA